MKLTEPQRRDDQDDPFIEGLITAIALRLGFPEIYEPRLAKYAAPPSSRRRGSHA